MEKLFKEPYFSSRKGKKENNLNRDKNEKSHERMEIETFGFGFPKNQLRLENSLKALVDHQKLISPANVSLLEKVIFPFL